MSTSTEQPAKKMISLCSSDGERFDVEEEFAKMSVLISNVLEEDCGGHVIPVSNVNAKNLSVVIDYCKTHGSDQVDEARTKQFDDDLVNEDLPTLFELILAANYMDIQGLLDLLAQAVADRIKDMKVEEVRQIFGIENDYTKEEEDAIRKENQWAFDP